MYGGTVQNQLYPHSSAFGIQTAFDYFAQSTNHQNKSIISTNLKSNLLHTNTHTHITCHTNITTYVIYHIISLSIVPILLTYKFNLLVYM